MNLDLPTNTLAGALLLALLGAGIKYVVDRSSARRTRQLERCSAQLEKLYGPLLALSHASSEAWRAFRTVYGNDRQSYWNDASGPPSQDEVEAWRVWMSSVFMPLNERMESVIIANSHLLEESSMPECLLELCAHVESYRGVVAEWNAGRFSKHTAVNNYPLTVSTYAAERFAALKQRQARLIGSGA